MSQFQTLTPDYEARVRQSFALQQVMRLINAKLVEVRPGYAEIHLPYSPTLTQQHGFLHAGIVGTIGDSAGGYAALSLLPAGASVLTVEYKLNLMSPAVGDLFIARGQVVKTGRTLSVCQVEVAALKNASEKLCALMQMTLMAMPGLAEKDS